jgi:hypothetical protein
VAPFSAKIMLWFVAWLPTSWLDFAFTRALGLKPQAAPRALPKPQESAANA